VNIINSDRENNIFGALKLIEQLYLDGEISGHVFRNILQEYKDVVCIADFTCYKKDKQKGGNT
jgi:chorismate mutase